MTKKNWIDALGLRDLVRVVGESNDTCSRCEEHITSCGCDEDHRLPKDDQLAFALWHYTTPTSPRFDLEFAQQIVEQRPDWFTDEQRRRIAEATARGAQ